MPYTSNPTAETLNSELTEMLNEERYARTLGNIARRAQSLWADGYTWEKFATDFYHIFTPAGEHYIVLLNEEVMPGCSCPAFDKYGECKHHLAIEWMVRDEQQADAFDAMMTNAEGPFGCDPNARF